MLICCEFNTKGNDAVQKRIALRWLLTAARTGAGKK
jgi:hypothetical protein